MTMEYTEKELKKINELEEEKSSIQELTKRIEDRMEDWQQTKKHLSNQQDKTEDNIEERISNWRDTNRNLSRQGDEVNEKIRDVKFADGIRWNMYNALPGYIRNMYKNLGEFTDLWNRFNNHSVKINQFVPECQISITNLKAKTADVQRLARNMEWFLTKEERPKLGRNYTTWTEYTYKGDSS